MVKRPKVVCFKKKVTSNNLLARTSPRKSCLGDNRAIRMAGNSDQERLRILKQEIEKQKKIAAERKKAIEEKEREKRRLERLAREARERREREQRMRRREE